MGEAEAKAKITAAQNLIYEAIDDGSLPSLQGAEQLARTALALGTFGVGGGGDATDASLQAILAKLPDYSVSRTTTAATHTATSGTVTAGAKVAYFYCQSGTATLFGGGLILDATDATGPSTFNLEYAGEGGHGAIAWSCTGTLIISETR